MITHPKFTALLLLQLCTVSIVHALSEEHIKAAYLERFAMFIQWPQPIEKYNVCIYEDKGFANVLEKSRPSNLFNNRPLNVIPLSSGTSAETLGTCHILYYRGSKPNQNTAILNHLQNKHVLVISDDADDAKKGGMLSFYLQNNSYRFIINQRNLTNANLSASYKLLNFGTVVDPVGK
ncbi:MAG: YfiR family protein [Sulfuricurvum sp.]|nr:YfiR family protein [Sulfuricurvum sp.]